MADFRTEKLMDVSALFELNGDQMRCRGCGRAIHITKDAEPMRHRDGCLNSGYINPWGMLRFALTTEASNG